MQIRRLQPDDIDTLLSIRDGIFDNPVQPEQARAFLGSDLHHLFVGFDAGQAVSFASGTVVLHPDKPPSLFINEVGTHEDHLRRGHAQAVVQALIDHGRAMGCQGIWLATEVDNAPARGLYRRLGAEEFTFVGYSWDNALEG